MNVLPLATALLLGFQHALEADHMVAVTTFVADKPTAPHALRFGFRWGFGHSLAVIAFGGVLLATGLSWPARYDAVGEGIVGAMLIGLGIWAVRTARKLHFHPPAGHGDHAHLHAHPAPAPVHEHGHDRHHPHAHDLTHAARHAPDAVHHDAAHHAPPPQPGGHAHPHPHPHPHHEASTPAAAAATPHPHPHHHGHGITIVGLMHGLAGSSAVVALVPVTLIGRWDIGLLYLAAFGVGVTLGMMLYASVAAYAMRRAADRSVALGRQLSTAVGVLGICVGLWWVIGAVRGA